MNFKMPSERNERGKIFQCLMLRYFSGIVSQYVSVESSSLTHHRPCSGFVYTLCRFIDGLGNLHADETF